MMILIICKRGDNIEETIPCSGNDGQSNTGILTGTTFPVRKTPSLNCETRQPPTHLVFRRKSGLPPKSNFNYLIYCIYTIGMRYIIYDFLLTMKVKIL